MSKNGRIYLIDLDEAIINGGFEDGLTGWEYQGAQIVTDKKYSGTSSCVLFADSNIAYVRQEMDDIEIGTINSFGLWHLFYVYGGSGTYPFTVEIHFTEGGIIQPSFNATYNTWNYTDLFPMFAYYEIPDTYHISKVVVRAFLSAGWFIYVDDVSLIYNNGEMLNCDITDVRMSESTVASKRKVINRSDGEVLDYGTWVHNPTQLELTTRLSDAEKTSIEIIFNANSTVYVMLVSDYGVWSFSGWLKNKSVVYEYSIGYNSEDVRPWKFRFEFEITSASFEGE